MSVESCNYFRLSGAQNRTVNTIAALLQINVAKSLQQNHCSSTVANHCSKVTVAAPQQITVAKSLQQHCSKITVAKSLQQYCSNTVETLQQSHCSCIVAAQIRLFAQLFDCLYLLRVKSNTGALVVVAIVLALPTFQHTSCFIWTSSVKGQKIPIRIFIRILITSVLFVSSPFCVQTLHINSHFRSVFRSLRYGAIQLFK